MATSDLGDAVEALCDSITVLHNIGLDSEGRSHHYDPQNHQVVVCNDDLRTRGVRDDDIEQRIDPPEWTTGTWDYIQFVRDEVDGLEWAETDAPEEPPEGN